MTLSRKSKVPVRRVVAVEVRPNSLCMAAVMHSEGGKTVRTRTVPWHGESKALRSDADHWELAAAFKSLVYDEKLAGTDVRIALSGAYCVTRVATGTVEHVRRELTHLQERTQLYLSLGPGDKAVASSVRAVDARHQHALLAVANRNTLDALVEVADGAGVQFPWIEPSLVALSRAVGHQRHDRDNPVLIIHLDEYGMELGVSHRGHLLLDYRPGGTSTSEDVATLVTKHLGRLQRYCERHFSFIEGHLERVYLCGTQAAVEKVRHDFDQGGDLDARVLEPYQLGLDWSFDSEEVSVEVFAALGSCLATDLDELESASPNLMEHIRSQRREPMALTLAKSAFPLAAAILVVLALFLAGLRERWVVSRLEANVASYEPTRARAVELRRRVANAETKLGHLRRIESQLRNPQWHDLIASIGHCMPDDVWLEKLVIDGEGKMALSGGSFGEDGIFEFVHWLESAPYFTDVALEGTRAGRFRSEAVTNFDIACEFNGLVESSGDSEHGG